MSSRNYRCSGRMGKLAPLEIRLTDAPLPLPHKMLLLIFATVPSRQALKTLEFNYAAR